MQRPLWQLLAEDPSDLTCDECFAVMEYYAEVLAAGGIELLPEAIEHLKKCPSCALQHRDALQRLLVLESESGAVSLSGSTGFEEPTPRANGTSVRGKAEKIQGEKP